MIELWLDDERNPADPFIQEEFGASPNMVWVKTASCAIRHLDRGDVNYISFDHDLGPAAGTGADVAKWIEEQAFLGTLKRLSWAVHSMNPVGKKNIIAAMRNAEKFWDQLGGK